MLPLDQPMTLTPRSGRRIAVTRSCPSQDRIVQPEFLKPTRRRASSSSSASKRRSVSSMNGLMPFALSSPVCSTASSPSPTADRVGNKVDGYFPEVLAKDLERSSSAFSSRSLTSGAPDAQFSLEDVTPGPSSAWAHRSVSSPYHGASGRPLVPIQERNSVVDFLDYNDPSYDGSSTDLDSMSGTEVSRGHAGPSLSHREQSIITAATSLTSSCWQRSPRTSPASEAVRDHSWIEPDSEEDEPDISDNLPDENLASLSPRPPTPPESDDSAGSGDAAPSIPMSNYNNRFHRKSYSIGGEAPIAIPRRRPSGRRSQSTSQPAAAPSMSSSIQWHPAKVRSHSSSNSFHRPRASSLQTFGTHAQHGHRPSASRMNGLAQHPPTSIDTRSAIDSAHVGVHSDSDEESPAQNVKQVQNAVFIRPSPPPSPLPSVQSWLDGSTQPYTAQGQGDDLPRAVPLPPNVVETLRVSVTCFPETMLLTSSLTVETIRNYSKKVRQPSADLMTNLTPDMPGDGSRRSLWKRLVSSKRIPSTADRYRPQSANPSARMQSPSSASLAPPKQPWVSLQNIFGCASDYICDALWAHIVAYNYISALVPRTPPQTRSGGGRSSTANDSQKEEIPKKAASLLGLAASQDTGLGMDRMAKKLTSQLSWGLRTEGIMTSQSARSATYDNATRDIQAGLMRCIMRLIATAKLMAENGTTAEQTVEMETQNVDVLFVRSLCEIVRMAEEDL